MNITNFIAQSRFQVLEQPLSAPAKCAFCGIGHNDEGRRLFIDTSLDLDFYGVVYMCSTCLNEIAESLGYISNDKWDGLRLKTQYLNEENNNLKGENEGLRVAVSSLSNHRCYQSTLPEPSDVELKEDPTYEDPTGGITKGVEPEESNPDEPNSESGLSNVRGTSKPKPGKADPNNDPLAEFAV